MRNIIDLYKDTLFETFKRMEYNISEGYINPKEILNWKGYMEYVIADHKKLIKKKSGRPSKNYDVSKMIDTLQRYLQRFTFLKTEKNIELSRKQASFIYKFLEIIGMFPNELSWETDNIRHILNKYRKMEVQKKELDLIEWKRKFDEREKAYRNSIKEIILNINKNK